MMVVRDRGQWWEQRPRELLIQGMKSQTDRRERFDIYFTAQYYS
jgi:hypothetical protein